MAIEYRQDRSQFWLKIFENDDSTNIAASRTTKKLAKRMFPQLEELSPTGWKKSKNNENVYNLWIPDDRMDLDKVDDLKSWAEVANKHIWLGLNRYINNCFHGNELDFCLAGNWNFETDDEDAIRRGTAARTPVGEAEYALKYKFPRGEVDEYHRKRYAEILINEVIDCMRCIPINPLTWIVTSIPTTNQSKFSLGLAKHAADAEGFRFMEVMLLKPKPQIKSASAMDKIKIWRKIYSDPTWLPPLQNIEGQNLLIIDDLYQSGASAWCYGEYLKSLGARKVIAISSVKALKDGDNT